MIFVMICLMVKDLLDDERAFREWERRQQARTREMVKIIMEGRAK